MSANANAITNVQCKRTLRDKRNIVVSFGPLEHLLHQVREENEAGPDVYECLDPKT